MGKRIAILLYPYERGLCILFLFKEKKIEVMKVKEIIAPLKLSDVGCNEKIARLNDIFAAFSAEVYELYPMKVIQKFQKTNWIKTIETKYPCIHVWGFFVKSCSNECMIDKWDCCAWYKRALVEELYWVYEDDDQELDANSYALIDRKTIKFKFNPCVWDCFVVYSKALPYISSLDDEVNIPDELISLLRLYIRNEYALEGDNDINMSANYYSRFQQRLNKLKEMYSNSVKYVVPWALKRVWW